MHDLLLPLFRKFRKKERTKPSNKMVYLCVLVRTQLNVRSMIINHDKFTIGCNFLHIINSMHSNP